MPLKIAIIDDKASNRNILMDKLLRNGNFEVSLVANDGREFLDKMKELHADQLPDVALMDLEMPILDGLRATERIREHEHDTDQHIPILAVTANALENTQERCLKAGMDAVLTKPITLKMLRAALDQWLPQPA